MANGMDECSFCSELYDADELIEVKDSLVKLKSGFKEFSEVIANVYMSKVMLMMTKRLSMTTPIATKTQSYISYFHLRLII